jgi:hypothetical protein
MISERNQQRIAALARKVISSRKVDKYSDTDVKCGVANIFLQITESFGVKMNGDYDEAKANFRRQLKAWVIGYGPFCFEYMEIRDASGKTFYCFITEVVVIYHDVYGYASSSQMENEKRVRDMFKILSAKVGFSFIDCHSRNLGLRGRNRKLLCIDFGNDR